MYLFLFSKYDVFVSDTHQIFTHFVRHCKITKVTSNCDTLVLVVGCIGAQHYITSIGLTTFMIKTCKFSDSFKNKLKNVWGRFFGIRFVADGTF